jgi:hypothetical protein
LRLGGALQEHLAPHREPEAANAVGIDIGSALHEGKRRLQIAVAGPAERVGIAFAFAFTAAVEEENAVAMAGEHPSVRLRALAAGEGNDGGTVPRGDVPAGELEPVAGRERHLADPGYANRRM